MVERDREFAVVGAAVVAELDLNPVLAGPDGCVAVDARIRIARSSRTASPKTW